MDMATRLPPQRLVAAIHADRGGRIFLGLLLVAMVLVPC